MIVGVHRRTELLLYDLLTGTLHGDERAEIESHLSACPRCARSRDRMLETLSLAPPPGRKPSDALPDPYWAGLAGTITRDIQKKPRGDSPGLRGATLSLRLLRPSRRWALGSAAAAVAAVALFLVFDGAQPDGPAPAADHSPVQRVPDADSATPGLHAWNAYLRRSRLLLTGISKAPEFNDLSIERKTSRELLSETRMLRALSGEPEAERLLNTVEPLMLKLANASETTAGLDRDLVRTGIRDHNLLFRLRMAEIASTYPDVVPVRGR